LIIALALVSVTVLLLINDCDVVTFLAERFGKDPGNNILSQIPFCKLQEKI
ncbi:unnamed protein product, partial [Allacma fusca]